MIHSPNFPATYRLFTLLEQRPYREGTGWLVTNRLIVTAFHVVGDLSTAKWFHDFDTSFTYSLDPGNTSLCPLAPRFKDPDKDLAILEIAGAFTPDFLLPVAKHEFVRTGASWHTRGFPSNRTFQGKSFSLTGTVSQYDPGRPNRHLQLHIREGTHISWKGMSGSPIVVDGEVVGVLTEELPRANSCWATSISLHHPMIARPMGTFVSGIEGSEIILPFRDLSRPTTIATTDQLRIGEFDYALALVRTGDDALCKNALQDLCKAAELGFLPSDEQRAALTIALDPLWKRSSYKTRNWLVKVVGLCRLPAFEGHLRRLFLDEQTDEESRSWALAAYSKLLDSESAIALMRSAEHIETSYRMAIQFYADRDLSLLKKSDVMRSMERNAVTAKWMSFLYGYEHPASSDLTNAQDIQIVRGLTGHQDNSVAEHALWALHRAKTGDSMDSSISLETLLARSPNIRRRAYLLVCKHKRTYDESLEYLHSRIYSERNVYAREGLALGLAVTSRYPEHLGDEIAEWYEREEQELVRLALLPHITTFAGRKPEYERILRELLARDAPDALATRRFRSIAGSFPRNHLAKRLLLEYSVTRGDGDLTSTWKF